VLAVQGGRDGKGGRKGGDRGRGGKGGRKGKQEHLPQHYARTKGFIKLRMPVRTHSESAWVLLHLDG
jgi:hypothetical protein